MLATLNKEAMSEVGVPRAEVKRLRNVVLIEGLVPPIDKLDLDLTVAAHTFQTVATWVPATNR